MGSIQPPPARAGPPISFLALTAQPSVLAALVRAFILSNPSYGLFEYKQDQLKNNKIWTRRTAGLHAH
ncbi:hypothetical protein CHELA1G11_21605 [Hyphomicrobiales bacterium]|nr:hypothetical protein CHELA1G11_21605 [Hyphomicrobiales bacterium]CAH1695201.1 hypothetical protein CHELA1G2_21909 [Hyphomicrobiales bacterium]